MSWLDKIVRPKIRTENAVKASIPDNLWHKCSNCEEMIFYRDFADNLKVCSHCGHHDIISPEMRLDIIFGKNEADMINYHTIELPKIANDPLKFKDKKRYADRLKDAREKSKHDDALVVAHGKISDKPLVVACFNFGFMAGSMGIALGEGLVKAVELAVLQQAPLLVIPASGGARMQEGILSLMQMARVTCALQDLKKYNLPYFVLLTHPTTGGVSASFAMLGDITLAEPKATIGFAGRRVIEETIRQKLPDDFQSSEYLKQHGMIDIIVERKNINKELARLLMLFS
jgi:acetyl-CoA carboxylase carboxyl transferase subunit beta